MKPTRPCAAMALIFLLCRLAYPGQEYSLHWRANNVRLAFSDENLPPGIMESIAADLQLCFRGWATNAQIMVREEAGSAGYIDYGSKNPYFLEGVTFPNNLLDDATTGLALEIPKPLSDAYTNAFAFAAANSNIVAAAYEFVAFVSSDDFAANATADTIQNYVLVKDMTSQYYETDFPGIVEGLFQYPRYYPPSLLGFRHSANGPCASNLYMTLPAKTNPGHGYDEWMGIPAIWHDGRWKICLGYEWLP